MTITTTLAHPRAATWAVQLGAAALALALIRAGLADCPHACGSKGGGRAHKSEALRVSETLATVYAVGAVLWPLLFQALVGMDALARAPAVLAALVWPIGLLLLDLSAVDRQTLDSEARRSMRGMTLESNSIASLTFAVGGLLMTHLGRQWTKAATPLLCAVVFFCVAFVTPHPALHARTVEGVRVHAMQRVALVYCIGLLSAAVLMVMQLVQRPPPGQPERSG